MKAQIILPTVQYGNITFFVEGTVEEILEQNRLIYKMHAGGAGLPPKEWNAALDRYLNDGTGLTEQYLAMSPEQQRVIQEIKRAFKRLTYHNGDTNIR